MYTHYAAAPRIVDAEVNSVFPVYPLLCRRYTYRGRRFGVAGPIWRQTMTKKGAWEQWGSMGDCRDAISSYGLRSTQPEPVSHIQTPLYARRASGVIHMTKG